MPNVFVGESLMKVSDKAPVNPKLKQSFTTQRNGADFSCLVCWSGSNLRNNKHHSSGRIEMVVTGGLFSMSRQVDKLPWMNAMQAPPAQHSISGDVARIRTQSEVLRHDFWVLGISDSTKAFRKVWQVTCAKVRSFEQMKSA